MNTKAYKKLLLISIFAFGFVLICCSINIIANNHKSEEEVLISYTSKEKFSLHEPIIAQLIIKNQKRELVKFDLGENYKSNFSLKITKPNGVVVNVPQLSWEGLSRIGRVSLSSKQTYSQQMLLNEWYDFNETGVYQVSINILGQLSTNDGKTLIPTIKNSITFEITPSDENLIKRQCESLGLKIEKAQSYLEASEAALQLSYIKDPTCLSYMKNAIGSHLNVDQILIEGIGRIQTNDAVEILIELAQKKDYEYAPHIKSVLKNLSKNIHDSVLKEKANRIIGQ